MPLIHIQNVHFFVWIRQLTFNLETWYRYSLENLFKRNLETFFRFPRKRSLIFLWKRSLKEFSLCDKPWFADPYFLQFNIVFDLRYFKIWILLYQIIEVWNVYTFRLQNWYRHRIILFCSKDVPFPCFKMKFENMLSWIELKYIYYIHMNINAQN